jgi:uncharacterized protein (TIGR02599 family)
MLVTRATSKRSRVGFTLVEVLLSMAVLSLIMAVMMQMVASTEKVWKNTSSAETSFREARLAFSAITDRVARASLNTYWAYDNPASPTTYVRKSELHFISGPASSIMSGATLPNHASLPPGHAIFFQAPVGFSTSASAYSTDLLNACGYFVEFGPDPAQPGFITTAQNRFRLMEMVQDTSYLQVYNESNPPVAMDELKWIQNGVAQGSPGTHELAKNVVLLIVWPKNSPAADASGNTTPLTTTYKYDTRAAALGLNGVADTGDTDPLGTGISNSPQQDQTSNQLPPLIEVTMIALDEPSAIRLQTQYGSTAPSLVSAGLFANAANYRADLASVQATLLQQHLTYHVFDQTVTVRQAQW